MREVIKSGRQRDLAQSQVGAFHQRDGFFEPVSGEPAHRRDAEAPYEEPVEVRPADVYVTGDVIERYMVWIVRHDVRDGAFDVFIGGLDGGFLSGCHAADREVEVT